MMIIIMRMTYIIRMIMMIIRMITKWITWMTTSLKLCMASGLKSFGVLIVQYIVNDYNQSYGRKLQKIMMMIGFI